MKLKQTSTHGSNKCEVETHQNLWFEASHKNRIQVNGVGCHKIHGHQIEAKQNCMMPMIHFTASHRYQHPEVDYYNVFHIYHLDHY